MMGIVVVTEDLRTDGPVTEADGLVTEADGTQVTILIEDVLMEGLLLDSLLEVS
jgi:copper oxidase (laccase) domain-containing protein